jgi:predicted glycosyltransferase
MRIFIDIGHPAHVHYFKNAIKTLQLKNHEFLITARNREGVFSLLKSEKLNYYNRGKGADSLVGKIFYLIWADLYLLFKSIRFKPDLFLSFASPYCAHVSKILGKPHIVFDDTEHAKLGHLSYQPYSDVIITPSCFYKDLGPKQIKFNGYIELFYLHKNRFIADKNIYTLLGLKENEKYIIVRFVSWRANHDVGYHGFSDNSKISILKELCKYVKVFISSESLLPPELEPYKINIPVEQMHNALAYASFYLGEGGTMASESSILGTPAIYVNSLPLMGYLRDEKEIGLLFHFIDSKGVLEKAIEVLNTPKDMWSKKKNNLLKDKIDVTAYLIWFIENYPESKKIMQETPDYQNNFK